jgi:hypothetical protein
VVSQARGGVADGGRIGRRYRANASSNFAAIYTLGVCQEDIAVYFIEVLDVDGVMVMPAIA